MSLLKALLLLLAVIYFGVGAALFFFQRAFIYFPSRAVSLPGLADVQLQHGEFTLNGHVANHGQEKLILYFGGNAEQIAYSIQQLAERYKGYTVVGFHYRGYSGSDGEPSEEALFADALFIYDQLAKPYDQVVAIGRSLGSGVAMQLGSQRELDQLVLVTPFDSVAAVAAKVYWFYPINWMIWDRYDSVSRAREIDVKTTLIVASEDSVVPTAHSERLFKAFQPGIAALVPIEGVGHNSVTESAEYFEQLDRLLEGAATEAR